METKHVAKFGVKNCEACFEIAKHKWKNGFICKRPGCGHIVAREGATPFSKQCVKCGRDESVTAQTVFEKLRISEESALSIVEEIIKSKKRLKIEELTGLLINAGFTDINTRSVWSLMNKVYDRMSSSPFFFDEGVLIILVLKKQQVFVVAKGKVNGEYKYNAQCLVSERHVHNFIKTHTTDETKVAYYVAKNVNSLKEKIRKSEIQYRPILHVDDKAADSLATKFHPWTDYIQPYLFKRNGGTYNQLMEILTKSS